MIEEQIKKIAEAILPDTPTYEDIEKTAAKVFKFLKEDNPDLSISKQYVIDIIDAERKIYQPVSTVIQDDDEGSNWLREFRASGKSSFRFWGDYKKSLTLPSSAIQEIDSTTDKILNQLANPAMPGNWYRAGLVVGHVQSGKTGNFVGLANKAMDCGYKIILVLTGMYNDLRSQTQGRMDKGAIGRITDPDDMNFRKDIGVGKFKGHPNIINLTSSKLKGDFGSQKTDIGGVLSSTDPTIMVCKKNSSVLSSILKMFSKHGVEAEDGLPIIQNTPLFIIDDEADSASINTEYSKEDVSKINSKIRAILSLFEKRCYVGYTATPYANIFIDPDPPLTVNYLEEDDGVKYRICKDDLFPKNFIINLSAPSNYIGPNVLFGIKTVYDNEDKDARELPIIEYIKEGDYLCEKDNNKKTKKKTLKALPDTLVEAIKMYFVSTALRRARGQKSAHSSMLINVSQYIKRMDDVAKLVQLLVTEYCDKLEAINDNPNFEAELKHLYETKIKPSNKQICEDYPDWAELMKMLAWENVRVELATVAAKVRNEVRVIHSPTDDDVELNTTRLDYYKYENCSNSFDNGLYVIAIGGNTMARGITLEGLVVSYFFRTSNTFDTLMQMGRWFGYRDGYIDACRLYIEKETATNFRNIAVATQHMRDDFEDMNFKGIKPKEYGLKVMRFPGILEATARNKFGSAVRGQLSLNKTTLQAYKLWKDANIVHNNKEHLINFLGELGHSERFYRKGAESKHYFWRCNGDQVVDFIKGFKIATEQMPSNLIVSYILRQIKKGNLVDWTVVLANVQPDTGKPKTRVFGTKEETLTVGPSVRGNNNDTSSEFYIANNAAISGPSYESLDLTDEEFDRAIALTVEEWEKARKEKKSKKPKPTSPYANCAKAIRKKTNGLLILFNVDFGDDNKEVFSYVLSLPMISDNDEISVRYEYMGSKNAFKILSDNE